MLDQAASINMRQFAVVVVLFFLAGASASPQNLADRIREGLEEVKEGLVETQKSLKMGPATEADSFMSAVIDRKAFDRISGYIEHAKASPNCSIVAGGGYDDSVGYFIEPTVVQTTTPMDKIFQEEIFGPVVTVYVYPDQVRIFRNIEEIF